MVVVVVVGAAVVAVVTTHPDLAPVAVLHAAVPENPFSQVHIVEEAIPPQTYPVEGAQEVGASEHPDLAPVAVLHEAAPTYPLAQEHIEEAAAPLQVYPTAVVHDNIGANVFELHEVDPE